MGKTIVSIPSGKPSFFLRSSGLVSEVGVGLSSLTCWVLVQESNSRLQSEKIPNHRRIVIPIEKCRGRYGCLWGAAPNPARDYRPLTPYRRSTQTFFNPTSAPLGCLRTRVFCPLRHPCFITFKRTRSPRRLGGKQGFAKQGRIMAHPLQGVNEDGVRGVEEDGVRGVEEDGVRDVEEDGGQGRAKKVLSIVEGRASMCIRCGY